jgi:hypothetical protein
MTKKTQKPLEAGTSFFSQFCEKESAKSQKHQLIVSDRSLTNFF